MSKEYGDFISTQNGIFERAFHSKHAEVGVSEGIERDPGVEPQAAYLIAWRMPAYTTVQAGDLSREVSELVPSITYDHENLHTTVSDYELTPDFVIVPTENAEQEEVLQVLADAVKWAISGVGAVRLRERAILFQENLTNGKTVVATGQPSEAIWETNQAVKRAAAGMGIELKGAWGSHMTLNRFLEDRPVEDAKPVAEHLDRARSLGLAVPTAIEVGYFHTSPENGFDYTTHERFPLGNA